MGQIEDLRLFLSVVDEGSIARASEAMGIAKSAVSRRLGQLEARYDMRLIDRQPGHWDVTKAGQELYQRSLAIVGDASELDADFLQSSQSLSGPLRISVPREFGMSFLRPTLYAFRDAYPEIEMTVDFDDRAVDLENENYDLAVRITSQRLDSLAGTRIGETHHGLYASPDYLAKAGTPFLPADLSSHKLLHYGQERRPVWEFQTGGKTAKIAFKPEMNSNSGAFLVDAALTGRGIINMLDFIVAGPVESGALVQVFPSAEFKTFGIYIVYSRTRRINKRMRALITRLEARCAAFTP